MNTKNTITILIAALLAGCPLTARAAKAPQQVIQQAAEEVRGILAHKVRKGTPAHRQRKKKLKKVVDRFIDYRELARRSLGPHWGERTPAQRDEFTGLLRDLIEESYTRPISKNVDFTMEYEEEEIAEDGATATVWAIASAENKKNKTVSEDLTFHMYLKNRGWMIYDISFGEVSMVRHYRGEFNRKIKKEGWPALLEAMRKKLGEIKSGKAKTEKQPKL